jgi:hypothetical protein
MRILGRRAPRRTDRHCRGLTHAAKAKALELAVEVEVCATSVGGSSGASPEPLDAAIMVAPAAAGFHQLARMQRDDGSTAEPLTTLTR